ncbi:Dedicator of cytokinesis protein 2-like protein [Aix galericulata]|nr:Dedicator of cytokinesis protein 2-like protein [Aix galericulata]
MVVLTTGPGDVALGKETAEFQRSLQRLFQTLNQLMKSPLEGPTLLSQGAALKYLPSILEDVFGIFDSSMLGVLLRDFIGNLLPQRLLKQKLQSLTNIINTKVFQSYECRELLLHTAVPILQELIEKGEEEDACIELLSNILEVLYKAQKVKVKKHVQLVLERLLHTVNRRVIVLERENSLRVSTSALPGSGTAPRPLLAPGMEQRGAALTWARGNRQQVVFFSWCCGLWQQLAGDGFMGI